MPQINSKPYIASLDGLRAFAVCAVIAYHIHFSWASGGFLGVSIFFVLSGFLITNILISDWLKSKRFTLKNFWMRRAKRLLPALFFMLAVCTFWVFVFDPSLLNSMKTDVLAAFFYVSNWWYIFHKVSYFSKFSTPSPLKHLWSLGVEEQFYLFFPFLLFFSLKVFRNNRKKMAFFLFFIAIASAVWMGILYVPGNNVNRIYYGTDTRAFSLLIGSVLALLFPLGTSSLDSKNKIWINVLGLSSFSFLLFSVYFFNAYLPFLYRGGFFLVSVATAFFIFVLLHPFSIFSFLFSLSPLRWLGKRSYGIYLWHYPVLVLTSPLNNIGGINDLRVFFQILATLLFAECSYRWIENPIRFGSWNALNSYKSATVGGMLALGLIVPSPFLLRSSSVSVVPTIHKIKSVSIQKQKKKTKKIVRKKHVSVTAIGDSIMLDIQLDLQTLIPHIYVDGKISRQFFRALPVAKQLKSEGKLGRIVVIELGTNGPFSEQQIQSLYSFLRNEKEIIFVNTRVPRPWQSLVNQMLAHFVSTHPRTRLANWYQASANHYNYFYPDGVHLNSVGSLKMATLIQKEVGK